METLVKLAGLLDIDVTDLIYGPRQISVSRRSLWLRLGAAIILFGIYLWLTPFSINYAAYHYSKIPEWYRMLLLLPAMFFSLGQLSYAPVFPVRGRIGASGKDFVFRT